MYILTFFIILFSTYLFGQEPLILDDTHNKYLLGSHLEILEDKEKKWTINDVTSPEISKQFIPSRRESPNFGFTSSAYWIRFKLKNNSIKEKEWLLELSLPYIEYIEFYIPKEDGSFIVKKAGLSLPFKERESKYRNFVFNLPTDLNNQVFYMRLQTRSPMEFLLIIWSPEAFAIKIRDEQILLGIYYGIMLVMSFYNFILFIFLRDNSYIYYLLYVISYGFFQMTFNGIAYEYIWPTSVWLGKKTFTLFYGFALIWGLKFSGNFLNIKNYSPRFDKFIFTLIILSSTLTLFSLLIDTPTIPILFNFLSLICIFTIIPAGIICLKKGYRPARYYLIAWSTFLFGGLLVVLKTLGILPLNFITQYGVQIGSALEVTLLSFGLADRINILKEQKEKAETLAYASQRLARYFPKKLVDKILSSEEEVSLKSQRKQITIFFTDLTGFTDLSDKTESERITNILNEYMTEMIKIIEKYGGTVGRFMGDGIMGFFGAHDDMEPKNQAKNAILMAIAMQKKIKELGKRWFNEGLDHNIKIRIGINQDYVTVGNFGSKDLMEFTAIGGGVNLASRLETSCTPGKIHVSFPVYSQTKEEFPYEELQEKEFKGFVRTHRTCELDPERIN